jgi:hypothetical protein
MRPASGRAPGVFLGVHFQRLSRFQLDHDDASLRSLRKKLSMVRANLGFGLAARKNRMKSEGRCLQTAGVVAPG